LFLFHHEANAFATLFSNSAARPLSHSRLHAKDSERAYIERNSEDLDLFSPCPQRRYGTSALLFAVAAAFLPLSSSSAMSFPKAYPGLRIGSLASETVCELFVDFVCPYSRKLFTTLKTVMPSYEAKVCFVFHNVIQPWHHQSLWLHETSFAVKMVSPASLLPFWQIMFEQAPNYYDKHVFGITRPEFYDKVAALGSTVICNEEKERNENEVKEELLKWLIPPMQPGGNFPEEARKLGSKPDDDENALFPYTKQTVKFHRMRGVHVTPTVFFNGIEQTQISSSWDETQWKKFLDSALAK
jgi:hypothetical protein